MSSRKLRLTLVALAMAVILFAGPTLSQAGGFGRFSGTETVVDSTASGFLSVVWSSFQSLLSTGAPEGGSLDPDGALVNSDTGGMLDPDGQHVESDNGGKLDPDG